MRKAFHTRKGGHQTQKDLLVNVLAIGTQIIGLSIGHGGERPLRALWMGGVGVKMQLRNSLP